MDANRWDSHQDMIGCGIEIAARRAICVALGLRNGEIVDLTARRRMVEIGDDEDPGEVGRFRHEIQALLESWRPDRIGILQRKKIGTFAAGGTTFKIEGLIQLYPHRPVEIVPAAALRAFAKENQPPMNHRYAYQKNAYLLACYLIHPAGETTATEKV
ncbi:MAG: DUF3010 family protein [Desulfobacterales bacterium]|nr:DUF3010 family protein [Desulfobacterales bacterium]